MEKIKSLTSNLPFSSSTSTSKFTNAFKFNSDHNVLRRNASVSGGGGNPFLDGPMLEEPSISRPQMILHITSIFFTFLAICTMGAVAGFQAKWFAVSGGTGFVLFLLLVSILLSIFMLAVPIIYDRWDRLKRPAQFLHQTRATFILHAFGTCLMLLSAFIVTISAWTEAGCKDTSNDPHAGLGDDFKNGLGQWCQTKKASGVFDWLSFGSWAALLILTALKFRRERRQGEPAFIPPSSPMQARSGPGISYSNILAADDERYVDKSESRYPTEEPSTYATPTGGYGYSRASADVGEGREGGRASVDPYGAFEGDGMPSAGTGGAASRTMQLAYNDPYAQIRAELNNPNRASMAGGYSQPGLPQPPTYGAYR